MLAIVSVQLKPINNSWHSLELTIVFQKKRTNLFLDFPEVNNLRQKSESDFYYVP